ncbi:acyl-CoA carboxylase subunit epsilon [Gordonia caeni]|uniref:Acyl-CoA carboxylase subunit epsilon n=1 Tax=Gordonia caeni TaxID=1007097 RepID=A0ABP7P8T5_9ACTN
MTAGDTTPEGAGTTDAAAAPPFLTVVTGAPTDEEVAALTVVLSAAASGGGSAPERGPADLWGRPTDLHRQSWGMPTSYLHRG